MKKFLCLALSALLILCSLCACSPKGKNFDESFVTLYNDSLENKVDSGSHVEITENLTKIQTYGSDEIVKTTADYSFTGGIGIGSNVSEFVDLFGIKKGYAMWETYLIKENNENITSYSKYNGNNIGFGSYDDRFLTVGYMTDKDGNWSVMSFEAVKSVWELEATIDSMYDIAIISAGLDANGNITKIVIDYGTYADFVSYTHNDYIQYV